MNIDILPFNDIDMMTIEELDKEVGWPLDYTSTIGLAPYIRRLGGNDVRGIEIGTCRGESTYYLLEQCPNISMIHTIDPYKEFQDWVGIIKQEILDKQIIIAQKNFEKFKGRVKMIREMSRDAAARFENEKYDFVFIDGDHSYDATLSDMINYFPKVRKGGIFAGHDYNLNTVRNAIMAFRDQTKVRIPIQRTTNHVWFFYK